MSPKPVIHTLLIALILVSIAASVASPVALVLARSYGVEPQPSPPRAPVPLPPRGSPEPSEPQGPGVVKRPTTPPDLRKRLESVIQGGRESAERLWARAVVTKNRYGYVELPKALGPEEPGTLRAVLVTGDEVVVTYRGGRLAVFIKSVEPSEEFLVVRSGKSVYVIPRGADLRRFDIELFNVYTLHRLERLAGGYLPLIVKVSGEAPLNLVEKEVRALGARGVKALPLRIIHSVALRVPLSEAAKAYEALSTSPAVVKVVLDRVVTPARSPPTYSVIVPKLYESVPLMGVPTLWSMGVNGTGLRIAILDTGIDPTHPDFYIGNESKIVAAQSFVDYDGDGVPDEDVIDGHGHGTHCAGIAAGTGGYLPVVKGVAPGASLIVGKVLSNYGFGFDSWIISGIEWAVNQSADVISMSLGGSAVRGYDPLVDAVNEAVRRGVVVVVAAGNEGPGYFTVSSPGVASGVITVGAVDKSLAPAFFTSWGPTPNATLKPDVVAPGVDIASARASGTYMGEPASRMHVYASGTSMATPHVAGYAALVLQLLNSTGILQQALAALPNATRADVVKDVIVSAAQGLGLDTFVEGAGFVNATRLALLLNDSRLLIVHPARLDLASVGGGYRNITVYVYNPFSTPINVSVLPELRIWSGVVEDVSSASGAVAVTPANFTVAPGSVATLNISIDFSRVPAGYHALILHLLSGGEEIGKALIGVSRPLSLTLNVTFEGEPAWFVATIRGYSPVFGAVDLEGVDWGWAVSGYGTAVVYPLYPDAFYLVEVAAWLPSNSSVARIGVYYTMLITNTSADSYGIAVDFSSIEPVTLSIGNYTEGLVVGSYGALLNVTSPSGFEVVESSTAVYTFVRAPTVVELRFLTEDVGVDLWNMSAYVAPRFFAVKAEVQGENIYRNSTLPIAVFYRYYTDAPRGEHIEAVPRNFTWTAIHAHSALGPTTLNSSNAMAFFGGEADIDVRALSIGPAPSYTVYHVDSNVDLYGAALDQVILPTEDSLTITAADYMGVDVGSGETLYAPMAMPRAGATIWAWSSLSRGLDNYNFTYGLSLAHVLRARIVGSYDIESQLYAIAYGVLTINGEPITAVYSPASMFYDYLEGFNWNRSELATATFSYTLDLTRYSSYISLSRMVTAETTLRFGVANYTGYHYINAFGYGTGVRDIAILGGFDYLLNYLPAGSAAYLVLFINNPEALGGTMRFSSITAHLVGTGSNGTVSIELPVVYTDTLYGFPLVYLLVNASEVLSKAYPGPFNLSVSLSYVDVSGGNSTATTSIYIVNAMYIGEPPYTPPAGPAVITVGPEGSGADFTSIAEAVRSASPGSVILVMPGEYHEELIVIDKPLTIEGIGGVPTVVAPSGYPVFIVVSSANITNLAIMPYSEASVPTGVSLPVSRDLLVPPAAIVVQGATLVASNLEIYGYPRSIALMDAALYAYGIEAVTDPFYIASGRRIRTLDTAPIYAYHASLLVAVNVSSNALPIIEKTPWNTVGLANITINDMLVDVVKNESVALENSVLDRPVIALGEEVVVRNVTGLGLEVVGTRASVLSSSLSGLLLSSESSSLEGSNVSGYTRIASGEVSVVGSSFSSTVVLRGVANATFANSTVETNTTVGLVVLSGGAARISIANSYVRGATSTGVYVVLRDADELRFVGNVVEGSRFGLLVLEVYSEAAPTVVIENNTFVDVAIPIYVAPSSTAGWGAPPYAPESLGPLPETVFPKIAFGDSPHAQQPLVSRVYLRYNTIANASLGVVLGGDQVAVLLGNSIEANSTGVEAAGPRQLIAFFNTIEAPVAINVSAADLALISYNNLVGNVSATGVALLDAKYNYLGGGAAIAVVGAGEARVEPQYSSPVEPPPVENPVVPWLNASMPIAVGTELPEPLVLVNPNPTDVTFDYRVGYSGAIDLRGETGGYGVELTPLGLGSSLALPDIRLSAAASGRAALVVDVASEGRSYRYTLPLLLEAPRIELWIEAPMNATRGQVLTVDVYVNSSAAGNYTLVLSSDGGVGICLDSSCSSYTYAYSTEISIEEGVTRVPLQAIAVRTGSRAVTAYLYVGYATIRNATTVVVLPNTSIGFSVLVEYYTPSIEVGYWGYVSLKVVNPNNVPLPLNVSAYSSNPNVTRVGYSTTITVAPRGTSYIGVPLYGAGVGNATVTVLLHDIDDGVEERASVNISVVPKLIYNYSVIGYGYVDSSKPTDSSELSYPNKTVWADLLIYLYASQAGVSLEKLRNLIQVPWGCVEQTTSPTLAAIQVYRYIKLQNLTQEAAEAMGMSVGELEDWIVNDTIARGVERLIEHHASHCLDPSVQSCVLGWYPGMSYSFFYTAYGLTGLLLAYEFQEEYNVNIYNATTMLSVAGKIARGLAQHQDSDGSWRSSVVDTSMALYALARATRLGLGGVEVNTSIERAIEWLLEQQSSDGSWGDPLSTGYALHALAEARLAGFNVSTDALVRAVEWLNTTRVEDGTGCYWASAAWLYGRYLTTARVVLALYTAHLALQGVNASAASEAYNLAFMGARFLAAKAYDWLRWGNTYAGAQILWAINSLGQPIIFAGPQPATAVLTVYAGSTPVLNASVTISGEAWWGCYIPDLTDVRSETMSCTSYQSLYTGDWLAVSKRIRVEVRLVGNATAYWFADTVYAYYPEEGAVSTATSTGGVKVPTVRHVYLGKGVSVTKVLLPEQAGGAGGNASQQSQFFEIEKVVQPLVVAPGGVVNVTIRVRSLNGTLSYVVVSDPVPSGFQLLNMSYDSSNVAFDEEFYNETGRLGFAIGTLGSGWVTISYTLRAPGNVTPGTTVTLDPASVRLFYEPEGVDTNTTSNTVAVTIGVVASLSSRGVLFEEYAAGVGNGTTVRWGEALNVSISVATGGLSGLGIEVVVLDENGTEVYTAVSNGTWILVDTADLNYTALAGRSGRVVVKLLLGGEEAARFSLSITFGELTKDSVIERAKSVVRLWTAHPELRDLVSKLAEGTVKLWTALSARG